MHLEILVRGYVVEAQLGEADEEEDIGGGLMPKTWSTAGEQYLRLRRRRRCSAAACPTGRRWRLRHRGGAGGSRWQLTAHSSGGQAHGRGGRIEERAQEMAERERGNWEEMREIYWGK